MLRLSLLQGEGGNICHYQIDGHKPVYQITAVGGVFNGFFFFCLQNLSHMLISLWLLCQNLSLFKIRNIFLLEPMSLFLISGIS